MLLTGLRGVGTTALLLLVPSEPVSPSSRVWRVSQNPTPRGCFNSPSSARSLNPPPPGPFAIQSNKRGSKSPRWPSGKSSASPKAIPISSRSGDKNGTSFVAGHVRLRERIACRFALPAPHFMLETHLNGRSWNVNQGRQRARMDRKQHGT